MTASSATTLKAKATITFKHGPSDNGKNARGWREAGYIPADSIVVDFPAKLLPDIPYISTTLRNGERGVMLKMAPDDLTDDLQIGAELVLAEPGSRGSIVTRDEAAARFAKWQTKARLRAV